MKTCKHCNQCKPFDQFYRASNTKDGYRGRCKPCYDEQVKSWTRANPDKCSAYSAAYQKRNPDVARKHAAGVYLNHREKRLANSKQWRDRNKERLAAYDRERRKKYPEREQARQAVRYALKRGELVKPSHCERCGSDRYVEAHHWSYAPEHRLDVEWICRSCHHQDHHSDNRLHKEPLITAPA